MRSLGAMSDTFTIGGDLEVRRAASALPIPGTSTVAHLEEIVAAAELHLSAPEVDRLAAADRGRSPA
jgi:aryl-alcohol dehydrogenase-like predicted oxidoreductase